ncbi:MAG: DUF368 domain-containing protein [Cellulosilyticum sp.]|nr:DUF368 domain-containing protein [Cellulosilyticum sp.]
MIILNIIRGICMAFADSVPGVSGGTVAFVMGFYSEFIESLNTLTSRNSKSQKKEALTFLFKLGIGWVSGFILSVLFIASVFETHIYNISSLFLGFIIFSLPLIYREEKETIAKHYSHLIYTVIGIVVVALITYFNPVSQGNGLSMSMNHFSLGMALYVFIAGMIAISAMVLPGISGSTLLLIFGLYAPIITGIKTLLGFNFAPLPLLICFGLGVIVGILSVVRLLSKLLITKRSQLIYLIFGLMIGSLYAIIMGPTTLEVPKPPMSFEHFNLVFFLLGALIILGLEKLKTIKQ